MKTYMQKKEEAQEKWYVVNAEDQILGRLAARIATVLRGKNEPTFTPHVNSRNHVIVINAEKIKLTGKKLRDKVYYRHTGWPGGIKQITAGQQMQKDPGELIRKAVKGMLPKNRLGSHLMKSLRVFSGPEHHHQAQQPEVLDLHTREAREELH